MKIAADKGYKVHERRMKPEELEKAQEVFVTGSAAEVTPVGKIDDRLYHVGDVTKTLMKAYDDMVHGR